MTRGFWENLEKPIIGLAPMDGVTDAAFRYMICKYGKPSVVITEFTNVEGLARGAAKMLTAFLYNEIERPIVGQIYGVEVDSFYKAAVMLCALGFDGIDINMGCPVNKVALKGSGAGLIKTPKLAREIIRVVKRGVRDWSEGISLEKAGVHPDIIVEVGRMVGGKKLSQNLVAGTTGMAKMNPQKVSPGILFPEEPRTSRDVSKISRYLEKSKCNQLASASMTTEGFVDADNHLRKLIPISVKTRIGYDKIVVQEWMKHLLEELPANISLHGRTLKQMYMGKANWEAIAEAAKIVKESGTGVSILGNGDIENLEDAREKIEQYGVDGVLIGRATFGNPWLFSGKEVSVSGRLEALLEHLRYFRDLNHLHFPNLKKHLAWYCKGFEGASQVRMKLMMCQGFEEAEEIIQKIY